MSPKKKVQEEFPGGDDMLAEEILQSALNDVSEDEAEDVKKVKDRPPEVTDEELARLDAAACRHEEARLEKMGVLEKMKLMKKGPMLSPARWL